MRRLGAILKIDSLLSALRRRTGRLRGRAVAAGRRLFLGTRRRVSAGGAGGIKAGRLIWMFGSGRSGSTWLAAMMEEMEDHHVWFEPRVGSLFDPAEIERYKGQNFILAPRYRSVWLELIRELVLRSAEARFPEAFGEYLLIKEPGGSVGAPLLMEALPESRMILLTRDPRDVAASWLDANRKGGWRTQRQGDGGRRAEEFVAANPNAFVKHHAEAYLQGVGNAWKAYEAHRGRKVVVRYEDLRVDTLGTMRRMYSDLGIPVSEQSFARTVEKHAWENIPEEEKGEGKFYRKASPGGWREDLTPHQVRIIEEITGPLLAEFYPDADR